MLTKKQHKASFKRTFRELSTQLWNLRRDRKMTIVDLSISSHTPIKYLEAFENKGYPFNFGTLAYLASFYDKRIKIELVDVDDDIKSLA